MDTVYDIGVGVIESNGVIWWRYGSGKGSRWMKLLG